MVFSTNSRPSDTPLGTVGSLPGQDFHERCKFTKSCESAGGVLAGRIRHHQLDGGKISIKPQRIIFQIGYNEKELNARLELVRSCGHEVISVPDNEAAKRALTSIDKVDVFVVGHTAPEQTRKEMVEWLKANFPKVKIVALIPSADCQLSVFRRKGPRLFKTFPPGVSPLT